MNKKALITVALSLLLVACGNNSSSNNSLSSENKALFVEEISPTCVDDGCKAYYQLGAKYYLDEELTNEIDKEDLIIPKLGHDYDVSWSYENNQSKATFICSRCSFEETIDGDDTIIDTSSCEKEGIKYCQSKVTFDGVTYYFHNDISYVTSQGHDYFINDEFVFASDYQSAACTLTCQKCGDKKALTTTDIIKRVISEGNCLIDGEISYTAKLNYLNNTYTSNEIVVKQKGNHQFNHYVYNDAKKGFYYQCSLCQEEGEKIPVYEDRAVTINDINFASPFACYDEDKTKYGITYDPLRQLFVINLNSNTIKALDNNLKINGINNEILINVEEDVTLENLSFYNGFRQLIIDGDGKLTVNNQFFSEAQKNIIYADLDINSVSASNGEFKVLDGVTTINSQPSIFTLTLGEENSQNNPKLIVNAQLTAGLASNGFQAFNVHLYCGELYLHNSSQVDCGISFNNQNDSFYIEKDAVLTIDNFDTALACWNSAVGTTPLRSNGAININNCLHDYRDLEVIEF